PFSSDRRLEILKTAGVPTWSRQPGDKTTVNGVGDLGEYDRDRAREPLHLGQRRGPRNHDDVWRRADQFCGSSFCTVRVAGAPTILDPHVAAVGPTEPLQRFKECRVAGLTFAIGLRVDRQHADPSNAVGLLRARPEWIRRRAAEQRDEVAPPHSITSSA